MELRNETINLLNSGKTQDVIDKITQFLDENPEYKTIDYYHFSNPIEEILFDIYVDKIDNIKQLGLDEPLDEIYHIYAIAHASQGKPDLALKYLKTANRINPVSAPILMRIIEFHQQRHEEEKIKPYVCDIFRYSYDVELVVSNYFKLADYLFHTNKNNELYDHLFNFFMFLKSDEEEKPVREDIEFFRKNNVPVGVNIEIIRILFYLIDVHTKQGLEATSDYFKNILWEVSDFNEKLLKIENEG